MKPCWQKLGLLYDPRGGGRHAKLATHAANPLACHLVDDIYRIFYSARDNRNRSSVGAVDIDIVRRKVIEDHPQPFFERGPPGSFYADGVSIGNCYTADNVTYMLFMGWQSPDDAHWRGDIGRLIVNPGLSLRCTEDTPFMTVDNTDRLSLSYPWVIGNDLDGFRMWYGSTISWDAGNGEMLHVINGASSKDGENWIRTGPTVPYQVGVAQAFSRPTVVPNPAGGYDMWFSYRSGTGEKYRIGYAFSADGIEWKLELENSGITVSDDGWDSEMIEYPFVFYHAGQRYMLYNGNGFGQTGFGLAVQTGG